MQNTSKKSVSVSDIDALKSFCQELNSERSPVTKEYLKSWREALGRELEWMVKAWAASGPNIRKLSETIPDLANVVVRHEVLLTETGVMGLRLVAEPSTLIEGVGRYATETFVHFLLNPENRKLRPCKKCSRYFVQRSAKQKVYCSGSCGHNYTSGISAKARSQISRAKKLQRVRELKPEWVKARTDMDWKSWIRLAEPTISKKMLTEFVKRGDLIPWEQPQKKKKGKRRPRQT